MTKEEVLQKVTDYCNEKSYTSATLTDAFKDKYIQAYPDAKKGSIATAAGMLYRFCYEVQVGDYVVFPSKSNREVNIGTVEGDYVYDPSQME